jgi:prepilin-type N-terminal cleavage/methylation domain-containing protein
MNYFYYKQKSFTFKKIKDKSFSKYNSKILGFTLLELLIVIAIIGVLASIVMASLNSSRNKAAASFVKQQADQIKKEFELYYQNNGVYGNTSARNNASPLRGIGYAGSTVVGPGDCWDPIRGNSFTKLYEMVGKGITNTNSPTGGNDIWCVLSDDGQRYAIAFLNMKSGPITYCFDSSGNIKESNTALPTSPINLNLSTSSGATCL